VRREKREERERERAKREREREREKCIIYLTSQRGFKTATNRNNQDNNFSPRDPLSPRGNNNETPTSPRGETRANYPKLTRDQTPHHDYSEVDVKNSDDDGLNKKSYSSNVVRKKAPLTRENVSLFNQFDNVDGPTITPIQTSIPDGIDVDLALASPRRPNNPSPIYQFSPNQQQQQQQPSPQSLQRSHQASPSANLARDPPQRPTSDPRFNNDDQPRKLPSGKNIIAGTYTEPRQHSGKTLPTNNSYGFPTEPRNPNVKNLSNSNNGSNVNSPNEPQRRNALGGNNNNNNHVNNSGAEPVRVRRNLSTGGIKVNEDHSDSNDKESINGIPQQHFNSNEPIRRALVKTNSDSGSANSDITINLDMNHENSIDDLNNNNTEENTTDSYVINRPTRRPLVRIPNSNNNGT
jgi:hypothetical protein